jgi:dTDP-D-glucose 4,6-dehydratase
LRLVEQGAPTLDADIRQTVAWYLDNTAWVANIASGGCRRTRIGLAAASS